MKLRKPVQRHHDLWNVWLWIVLIAVALAGVLLIAGGCNGSTTLRGAGSSYRHERKAFDAEGNPTGRVVTETQTTSAVVPGEQAKDVTLPEVHAGPRTQAGTYRRGRHGLSGIL